MAAKLKTKRTSITTMGAKIKAFDIFQTPLVLITHYLYTAILGWLLTAAQPELQHPQHN
jgi:hypothetical protein